jgi:hypothetical protein
MLKRMLLSFCAAVLLLFAFIFVMGTIKLYRHPEHGGSAADWIVPLVLGVICGGGGAAIAWRLRPSLTAELLLWPSVQAFILYAAALPIMLLAHSLGSFAQVVAFFAFCAFCLSAPFGALKRPRWTTTALSAIVWGLLLFGALTETAEAVSGQKVGEAAMVYLLPIQGLAVLLAVVGLVRLGQRLRRSPEPQG